MRCQGCLMPSMCVLCERIFDARYDFREGENLSDEEVQKNKKNALLCWDCREKFVRRKSKR